MSVTAIKELLGETGKKLRDEGLEASPQLRTTQGFLKAYESSDDSHIKFLAFFLFNFIEDFYYNLTGDFPYKESTYKVRADIYRKLGKELKNLADNYKSS